MTPELWVGLIVVLFGGGGIGALFKLRGENTRIYVDASQGAVIVQSSVIKDLREQIEAQDKRIGALENRTAAAEKRAEESDKARRAAEEARDELARENDQLLIANDEMLRINRNLEGRVDHLEAEVARLSGNGT